MKHLWNAFLYSLSGLTAAWRDEPAFRQEAVLAVVAIPLAFYIAPNGISLALMTGSILLVLIVELLNTAIEATTNRIGADIHPLVKKAKDTASAAVLVALVNTVVVWVAVLFLQ